VKEYEYGTTNVQSHTPPPQTNSHVHIVCLHHLNFAYSLGEEICVLLPAVNYVSRDICITPYVVLDRQRKIIVVLTVPFAQSHLTLSQYNQISLRYIVVIISCHFLDYQSIWHESYTFLNNYLLNSFYYEHYAHYIFSQYICSATEAITAEVVNILYLYTYKHCTTITFL
jgi:hypothetical protein